MFIAGIQKNVPDDPDDEHDLTGEYKGKNVHAKWRIRDIKELLRFFLRLALTGAGTGGLVGLLEHWVGK